MDCCRRWTILFYALWQRFCLSVVLLHQDLQIEASSIPENTNLRRKLNSPIQQNSGKILLTLEGIASYYANDFNGKQTSNGEIFDMNALTAAHRTFPFGTKVRVTNLENNKIVVVRVE